MKTNLMDKILSPQNMLNLILLSGLIFFMAGFISGYHLANENCFYQLRYQAFIKYANTSDSLVLPNKIKTLYDNWSIQDVIVLENETIIKKIVKNTYM